MDELLENIIEVETEYGGRIFAVRRSPKDVITISGSVLGGWNLLPHAKQEATILFVYLLDTGTKTRSKDELRASLAERGAQLSFSGGSERLFFNASCLPGDVPFILDLITDCIQNTVFTAKEFENARTRLVSRIKNNASSTSHQANVALTRMIYAPSHPNYSDSDAERLKNIAATTLTEVKKFQSNVGQGGLVISLVGDIDAEKASAYAKKAFSTLRVGTTEVKTYAPNSKVQKAQEKRISISHKATIDVLMGVSMPMRYADPEYMATVLCVSLLGGSSTGHLTETIRERDGLTYDIRASLNAMSLQKDGYFEIETSFAPSLYKKGVETTLDETKKFLLTGITASALEAKKRELTGRYIMNLSTTYGLAGRLQSIGERGELLTELTNHPERIKAVTHKEVRAAAAKIPVDTITVVAAGSFE